MSAFDKIIGYEGIKKELERFCDVFKNSEKYEKLGVTLPSGIMFCGEPGIGKTLMAKCFIEESGVRSYTVRKDKPDGDFTNKIRETFEKARQDGGAIIFLDDMDKFANEDERHPDAEEYVTVQACIDESKGKSVFVIATVNEKRCLPYSLLRTGRFDKTIEMKSPDYKDTVKLVEYYLTGRNTSKDIDASEIAEIMTGSPVSDIESMINEAGINAGYDGRHMIERRDVLKAIVRSMFDSPECSSEDEEDSEAILIHELGHVVTAEALEPGSVSLVTVEAHNGSSGGICRIRGASKNRLSRKAAEHQVIWCLGGRAATEMMFGELDIGSSKDIETAYDIVRNLQAGEALNGFELYENMYSRLTEDKRDLVVARELTRHYQTAKKIIASNRSLLICLADVLRREKTLTSKEIREIIDRFGTISRGFENEVGEVVDNNDTD